MVVCVLLPRFALSVAAGGRAELARGPVALAPEPGREPLIGEASAAAEAHGVKAGLRLGEALARCPTLRLVAPDPAGVADEWDRVLVALEGIGAEVESERAGVACFDASGLLNLHGGLDGVLTVTRRALRGAPARLGVAPSRFAAVAAASKARPRRAEVTPGAKPPFGGLRRGRAAGAGLSGGGRRGRTPSPPTSRRSRSRCSARARRPPRCPSRWSGSGSARSGSSPRCRAPRWPTASAPPGRSRATSPAGATPRSSRAGRRSGWRRRWSCRSPARGRSSSTRSAC